MKLFARQLSALLFVYLILHNPQPIMAGGDAPIYNGENLMNAAMTTLAFAQLYAQEYLQPQINQLNQEILTVNGQLNQIQAQIIHGAWIGGQQVRLPALILAILNAELNDARLRRRNLVSRRNYLVNAVAWAQTIPALGYMVANIARCSFDLPNSSSNGKIIVKSCNGISAFAQTLQCAASWKKAKLEVSGASTREIQAFAPVARRVLFISLAVFALCYWLAGFNFRMLENSPSPLYKLPDLLASYIAEVMHVDDVLGNTYEKEKVTTELRQLFAHIFMDIVLPDNHNELICDLLHLGKIQLWSDEIISERLKLAFPNLKEEQYERIKIILYEHVFDQAEIGCLQKETLPQFVSHFMASISMELEKIMHSQKMMSDFLVTYDFLIEDETLTQEELWGLAAAQTAKILHLNYDAYQATYQKLLDNIEQYEDIGAMDKARYEYLEYFLNNPPEEVIGETQEEAFQRVESLIDGTMYNQTWMGMTFPTKDRFESVKFKPREGDSAFATKELLRQSVGECTTFANEQGPKISRNMRIILEDEDAFYDGRRLAEGEIQRPSAYTYSFDNVDDITPHYPHKFASEKILIKNPPSYTKTLQTVRTFPLETLYPSSSNQSLTIRRNIIFSNFPDIPTPPFPKIKMTTSDFIGRFLVTTITASLVAGLIVSTGGAATPLAVTFGAWVTTVLTDAVLTANDFGPTYASYNAPVMNGRRLQDFHSGALQKIADADLSLEDRLFLELIYKKMIARPLTYAVENNHTVAQVLANITSQFQSMQYASVYQELLKSQYGILTDNPDACAADHFTITQGYENKLRYKQTYNDIVYQARLNLNLNSSTADDNGRLLAEETTETYYQTLSVEDYHDLLYRVKFGVYNFTLAQWGDLMGQINHVVNASFAMNFPFYYSPTTSTSNYYIYRGYVTPPIVEIDGSYSPFENATSQIEISMFNMTSEFRTPLISLINNTIINTFYIGLEVSSADLISSISNIELKSEEGIKAIFKIIQTDQNYYNVIFDGSFSYTLWDKDNVLAYMWDFGDATPIEGASDSPYTSHTYLKAGKYYPSLTIKDIYNHRITARALNPVTILYTLAPKIINNEKYFIGSRNQVWMFVSGNIYEPISPFVTGANAATWFTAEKADSENTFALRTNRIDGNLTDNYLAMWNYPSPSNISLQASWYTSGYSKLAEKTQWLITPITDEPGYYRIRKDGKFLNIYGELNNTFDDQICAFTFAKESLETQDTYTGQLYEIGSKSISNVQIVNLINSNSVNNQIKVYNPNTDNELFNFISLNYHAARYYIADLLNQDFVLTGVSSLVQIARNITPVSIKQLWSVAPVKGTPTLFTIRNEINNDSCLSFTNELLQITSCNAANPMVCKDFRKRYIMHPTCHKRKDYWKCDEWKRKIPIFGGMLYRQSCRLEESGHYYCQDALNEATYYKEAIGFAQYETLGLELNRTQKCTPEPDRDPFAMWYLKRKDADEIQVANKKLGNDYDLVLKRVTMKNAGYKQYFCSFSATPVLLESCSFTWDFISVTETGAFDIPNRDHIGYHIQVSSGRWITGDGDDTILVNTYEDTIGRFMKLKARGYNLFQIIYGWGNRDTKCLTPVENDHRATGNLKDKILFKWKLCDPTDPNQFWSFEKA